MLSLCPAPTHRSYAMFAGPEGGGEDWVEHDDVDDRQTGADGPDNELWEDPEAVLDPADSAKGEGEGDGGAGNRRGTEAGLPPGSNYGSTRDEL